MSPKPMPILATMAAALWTTPPCPLNRPGRRTRHTVLTDNIQFTNHARHKYGPSFSKRAGIARNLPH